MPEQKFYLTNELPHFTPTNFRGNWNTTANAVTKMLDTRKTFSGGAISSVSVTESVSTNPYRVCLFRGVSGPLAANALWADMLNVMIGMTEDNAAADFNWHIHAYITAGDTDTVRSTILNDYEESAGTNELEAEGSTTAGKTLNAAQAVSGSITAGDRLVVEIGYTARNTVTTTYMGRLFYGIITPNKFIANDLTVDGDAGNLAGFISFSTGLSEGTVPSRFTQVAAEVLHSGVPAARFSQSVAEVLHTGAPAARFSQTVMEVLRSVDSVTGGGAGRGGGAGNQGNGIGRGGKKGTEAGGAQFILLNGL